jgi:6-pyruvoyltetrahydropterin/6-carboxytetrahydropterin synthase
MIVTARLTFSAAHRLHNPKFDAAWNRNTYDKCDNPGGHGHNYRVDHKNLNTDVDFLRGIIPTAENLARAFWKELAPAIAQGSLHEIALQETEKNSVIYRGEDEP